MKSLALAFLLGLFNLAPSQVVTQETGPCPAETTLARQGVTFFNSSTTHAETRRRYALPTVDSARVRVLTGEQDAEACIRLRRFVASLRHDPGAGRLPTFYEADGYYYVYLDLEPRRAPAQAGKIYIDMRWRSLFAIDSDFNQVAALAM